VSADEQFEIKLLVTAQDSATDVLRGVANGIAGVNEKASDPGLNNLDKKIAGIATSAGKAETATRGWAESLASLQKAQLQSTLGMTKGTDSEEMAKRSQQTALYNQYLHDEDKAKTKLLETDGKAAAAADRSLGQRDAHVQAFNRQNAATETASKQTALYNQYLHDEEKAAAKATAASANMNQSLSTTRYALYDVAGTATVTGLAMAGLATAIFATGIAWERDFANVVRTASLGGDVDKIAELRQQFVELNQTLPVTASTLAEIGALGGQLGIDSSGLQDFTTVVAQLTATTDLSAEAAGTALGRFQALLGVPSSEFSNLASSILKVGINSVATETQIVNVATQISSMGAFAGLTADQVIGLAGALASVGAAPEISRGTVTRTFTLMSKAIAAGGEKLDGFAKLSGVSAEQFKASWGTEAFAGTFQAFLKGVAAEGGNAVQALNDLGITSVRDVPLLMRLAKAQGVVTGAFADAATGYQDNTELANQYSIIAGTMASKLQLLANNFQQFLVAIADGGTVFGGLVDGATDFLQTLTDVANDPFWGTILQGGVLLMGLVGIFLLVAGAVARTAGGVIALNQATLAYTATQAGANVAAGTGAATFGALGLSAEKAALASKVLGATLKALTIIGLALVLPDIASWAADTVYAAKGLDTGLGDTIDRIAKDFDNLDFGQMDISGIDAAGAAFQRFFAGFDEGGLKDVKNADEALAEMAKSGNAEMAADEMERLSIKWQQAGGNLDAFKSLFPDATKALADYKDSASASIDPTKMLADAQAEAAAQAETLATALGLVPEELAALQKNIQSGSSGFVDFGDLIQRVQDKTRGWAEKQSEDVYDSKDSWQEFYDGSSVNIQDFMGLLDEQIAKQGTWANDMQILSAAGATAFVTEIARMGPEGAPLAAAAAQLVVTGATDELNKLEDNARLASFLASEAFAQTFTEGIPNLVAAYEAGGIEAVNGMIAAQRQQASGEVPGAVGTFVDTWNSTYASKPIKMPVDVDTAPASTGLDRWMIAQSGKTISVGVKVADGSYGKGLGVLKSSGTRTDWATGGPVFGPGTGTSDSIPARLSNGEYVIKASRVRQFGTGYFNALNSGHAPRQFASGGPVGGSSAPSSMGGVVELGPKSLARLGREVTNNIMLDDMSIARAANRGNRTLAGNGAMQ